MPCMWGKTQARARVILKKSESFLAGFLIRFRNPIQSRGFKRGFGASDAA